MNTDRAGQNGEEIDYVVTFLEMDGRPSSPVPHAPAGLQLALLAAADPPPDYFLYLYRQVGASYEWTDWLSRPRSEVESVVGSPDTVLHTLIVDGWPGGFFMLDGPRDGVTDLAYFGLVPQAIGRGLGGWLLGVAVHAAWDRTGTERLTVNTNTLDHPRALGLYQRMGFSPIRRETHRRRIGDTDIGMPE